MIHLYAFTTGLECLPSSPAIDDAPLEACRFGDVVAVFSSHAAARPERVRAHVVRHGVVVSALVDAAAAVLPARFGEEFQSIPALEDAVSPRLPHLRERLVEVARHVEIGVRVLDPAATGRAQPRAGSGAEYLRALLPTAERRDVVASELHAPLVEHAADHRLSPALERAIVHVASYLVPRDDLFEVTAIVERFTDLHPELTVVCTGPWAPYSFAETS